MIARKITTPLRCEKGVSTIEFAMILMPLCMIIMGTLEFGYRIYGIAVVNGALRDAARMASTGEYTGAQIDSTVTNAITGFRRDANVIIVKKSYADFTGVGVAEPVTSGTVASGTYCYQDINNNGQWDEDQGKTGLGNPDDVVYYDVKASYSTLFRFSEVMFGVDNTTTIEANTLMSNEPFAPPVQSDPATRCVVAA